MRITRDCLRIARDSALLMAAAAKVPKRASRSGWKLPAARSSASMPSATRSCVGRVGRQASRQRL